MPAPGAPGTPEAPAAAGRAGRTRKAPTPGPGAAGGRAPAAETASAGASPTRAPLASGGSGADPSHSAHTVDAAVSRPGLSTPSMRPLAALVYPRFSGPRGPAPPVAYLRTFQAPSPALRLCRPFSACPHTSPTRPLAALVFRRPVRLGSSTALPSAGHPLSALPQPPSAPFSAAWPFATSLVSPGPLLWAQTGGLAGRSAGWAAGAPPRPPGAPCLGAPQYGSAPPSGAEPSGAARFVAAVFGVRLPSCRPSPGGRAAGSYIGLLWPRVGRSHTALAAPAAMRPSPGPPGMTLLTLPPRAGLTPGVELRPHHALAAASALPSRRLWVSSLRLSPRCGSTPPWLLATRRSHTVLAPAMA